MATKSFLSRDQLTEALVRLKPPSQPPDGNETRGLGLGSREFSIWLGACLKERLSLHPDWQASEPVIVGSWSREELSPKSDIDLLFLGPEDAVSRLVQDFAREGIKLRYRVPENPEDWTVGVQPFDVVALLSAVPVGPVAAEKLHRQLERLKKEGQKFRRHLLSAMRAERKARNQRHDSISNFLEPNLKFGPGGLRDLEQALITRQLFSERFASSDHAFIVLLYYKTFFLLVRQRLHLAQGSSDVLVAPEQKAISDWLGFKDVKDFMREIQKGLSRVSFYADWAIAQAASPAARLQEVERRKLDSVTALFQALEDDPSILMQNRVRLAADRVFLASHETVRLEGAKARKLRDQMIGRRLGKILDPGTPEGPMIALFRSHLIDHCVPDFRFIIGHVQHDQYHRFSVDAHLLQVLRELKRFRARPSARGGRLARYAKELKAQDWQILAFACLFHDIAKGRGGDHSVKGVEVARRELERFGKPDAMIREVCWIVEEHLALSAAAFRENPRSPRTWRGLHDKGVKGTRIRRLAVFTVADILGTNPEAWTSWKERLLFELTDQLEKPETDSLLVFADALRSARLKGWERFIDTLDPFLIGSVPAKILIDDLRRLTTTKEDLPVRVLSVRGGQQTWARFHSALDRPGLFLGFVRWLASCGLAVRHASIHTDPGLGVYDWFEVKTSKSPSQVQRSLESVAKATAGEKSFQVRFDSIELVSSNEGEWVISFRGRDQNGALTEAARALFELGAQVRWAKVHTWGRQIDDVFGISPPKQDSAEVIALLTDRLGPKV